MEWYHYALALGGAILAGSINTLAGNGSVITLGLLTELVGLPGNVANGTNRIGVLFNGAGGTWGFYKAGKLDTRGSYGIVTSVILGAVVGGIIAVSLTDAQFMMLFKFLMIVMLVVILIKPSRWMINERVTSVVPEWVTYIIYFILGIYGGVIQMGMGIFFLAAMVLLSRYPLLEANAVKALVVTVYTLLMIILFHARGLIDWPIGLLFGLGQFVGGWMTAHTAARIPGINRFAYFFLIAIVVLSLASMFRII